MKHELYFASGNLDKFEEVQSFCARHAPHLDVRMANIDVPEVQSYNQKEVAIKKAQAAYKQLGKPVIVDDSGAYFAAYPTFPGPFTKQIFYGIGTEGVLRLLGDNTRMYFKIMIAYADGHTTEVFEGIGWGRVVPADKNYSRAGLPMGDFFVPDGETKTYSQLKQEGLLDDNSHRGLALKKFVEWYKQYTSTIFTKKPIELSSP